jgi:putative CocE/NonD family hydrolase
MTGDRKGAPRLKARFVAALIFRLGQAFVFLSLPQDALLGQFPLSSAYGDREYGVEDVFIRARDGIRLHARVWMPTELEGPVPSILSLTPYTSDDGHRFGTFYASHGYVYVNADVRGRGESEGESWPLEGEGQDGADIIRWIVDQPWSDGTVGMRGGSYRGMTQWQTLRESPEGLVTAVPTASVHPGWDYPNPSGIFLSYAARWLAFVDGNASQANLFGDNEYWTGKYREIYAGHRPFAELDDVAGLSPRVFERWIAHPWYDSFWQAMNPAPADYARIEVPLLTISGYFDGDQPGAMKYYQDHMAHGSEVGARTHYLILGPWNHAGTRLPQSRLGGMTFGENSVLNMEAVHLAWFEWTLRGQAKPEFLHDRVAYYVMDSDEWRFAPTLSRVSSETRAWHLSSDGPVADVFHSGVLGEGIPDSSGVDRFVYDPLETPEAVAGGSTPGSYVGGGLAFLPGPKAVYHSPPLTDALTVSGYATLELYVELDVPDTDLLAGLYEIRGDGTTILLGQSELRARHRGGVDRSELVTPGVVEPYSFDRFYWFSRTLRAGSRIRLVVKPLNSPERDKNYNTGGNTIQESGVDARKATVRIHHGRTYPSRLILPVDDRQGGKGGGDGVGDFKPAPPR